MLQPESYPRLLGQALTLEPAPFVEMVDDDNPWIEGLFFTFLIGVAIGIARLCGGLLLTASLPPADAVLETLVLSLKQGLLVGVNPAAAEEFVRQVWPWMTALWNYDNGWLSLLFLIATPLALIGQWLLYGLISHGAARALGGSGSLGQTLGAVALSIAPRILLVATLAPFASVSGLLVHVWGVLIAYRGLEVAHDLPPGKAAAAALVPLAVGVVGLGLGLVVTFGLLAFSGGGA